MCNNKRISLYKVMAVLLSVSILLTTVFSGTFAQLITKTPSFINTFLSGLTPTGDLIISKEITHPFGDSYIIPEGLSFDFSVALGESYIGKTVKTSQGDITADENGNISLSMAVGTAVRIFDLEDGTTVTVTESSATGFTPDGGTEKSITIQRGENSIAYINDYKPMPIDFTNLTGGDANLTVSGTKVLDGREWQEGDSFTFQLDYKLSGEETWEKAGETTVTYELIEVTNSETQEVRYEPKPYFDKFSFTELVQGITYDTVGEYSFRVSEVDGTIGGITYDKVVSYFDVTVGDADMDGFLEIQDVKGYQNASASYDESAGNYHVDVTVNNKYAPVGTATATININKRVDSYSGEEKSAAGYTFELYDESGNLVATSGETSAAGETFIELTFEAKDAGETFHYTLKETHGGENINGMVYADTVYSISVSVEDNLDGTIFAYVYSTDEYQTELITVEAEEVKSEEIEPEQTVSGNDIVATDSNATREEATEETVSDESISEQTESEGEETETEETQSSASKDSEDEAEETESESITVATDSNAVPQTASDGEGEQTVSEENTPVVTSEEAAIITDENDDDDEGDELTGISTDSSADITNESVRTVLTASVPETREIAVIPDGASNYYAVYFVNVYDPDDTSASFDGIKKLTGRTLKEGEFIFELYATGDNFTINEGKTPIQTVTHDAEGEFNFMDIEYDEVGIYRYMVKEDASGNLGGITYDESVFRMIVTVSDENGALKATTQITDELGADAELIFENKYKAAPTSITFSGTKTLTGKDLSAEMFKFLMYKADENYNALGAAMAGAYNDDSGTFKFDSIEFDETGTFHYVVKEDSSAAVEGMTYDDTAYGIEVDVWDDGAGSMKADVVIIEVGGSVVDEILFENNYTKPVDADEPDDPDKPTESDKPDNPDIPDEPTKPDDPIEPDESTDPSKPSDPDESEKVTPPKTGDDTNVGLYVAVMFISVFALIILLVIRKKEKPNTKKHE